MNLKSILTGLAFAFAAALGFVAVTSCVAFSIFSRMPGYWGEYDWTRFIDGLLHSTVIWLCAALGFACGVYFVQRPKLVASRVGAMELSRGGSKRPLYGKSVMAGLAAAFACALAFVAVQMYASLAVVSQLPGYWEFRWTPVLGLLRSTGLWVSAVIGFGCGFYWMLRRRVHRGKVWGVDERSGQAI